jgi:hypothetical protein
VQINILYICLAISEATLETSKVTTVLQCLILIHVFKQNFNEIFYYSKSYYILQINKAEK